MSAEFHQEPESQGKDRGEELNRFGQAPEGDGIWESGEGGVIDGSNDGNASQYFDADMEGDAAETWDDLGAEAPMPSDEPAPNAPPAEPIVRGSGVELPRNRIGWDGRRGRKLVKPDEVRLAFSPQERLLILDTWQRSGLPAGDFAPLVGLSKHTLYLWKKRFAQQGPAGLMEQQRGASTGSRLSEVAKRTIVMLKRKSQRRSA